MEYLPYGETWFEEGNTNNAPKYNSQELDKETGYYFYNARHYDPQISRFVTPDSVVPREYDTQSWNRYSYCSNNPIEYKDPTGHTNSPNNATGNPVTDQSMSSLTDLYSSNQNLFGNDTQKNVVAEKATKAKDSKQESVEPKQTEREKIYNLVNNPVVKDKIDSMRKKTKNEKYNYGTKENPDEHKREYFTWLYKDKNDIKTIDTGTPVLLEKNDRYPDGRPGGKDVKDYGDKLEDNEKYKRVGSIHTHPDQEGKKIKYGSFEDVNPKQLGGMDLTKKGYMIIVGDRDKTIYIESPTGQFYHMTKDEKGNYNFDSK